jgi:hypothetical protein
MHICPSPSLCASAATTRSRPSGCRQHPHPPLSFLPHPFLPADYDRATKEGQSRDNVTLAWSLGLNKRHVARFYFPKDSADLRLMVGECPCRAPFLPLLPHPCESRRKRGSEARAIHGRQETSLSLAVGRQGRPRRPPPFLADRSPPAPWLPCSALPGPPPASHRRRAMPAA